MKVRGGSRQPVFHAFAYVPHELLVILRRKFYKLRPLSLGSSFLFVPTNTPPFLTSQPITRVIPSNCALASSTEPKTSPYFSFRISIYRLSYCSVIFINKTAILGTENGCFVVPRKQKGAEAQN